MGFSPLAQLLNGQRAPSDPVVIAGGQPLSYELFARSVAAVAALAEREGRGRWLLGMEDAWHFSVGFFGLLRAGCSIAIPPNHLPATLERLRHEVDGILTDTTAPGHHLPEPGDSFPDPSPLADGTVAFWTSGSTGEAKCIEKRLSQLSAEVEVLEATFGHRFEGDPVLGTVPHQHIYGCLFRILWPLATGRPLVTEVCGDPDRLRFVMGQASSPALVSSPALLARLPNLVDLDHFASAASVIFSSGGPLATADAIAWRKWIPKGIAEIYGSTETGGIAWRVQSEEPESSLWTPFPDVTLAFEPDGALRVQSYRVGPEALRMEDAAECLSDGRFRLLGRLDRIVKIEEKRVSLPELEAALETHPWVHRAAITRLDGARVILGAVIVLALDCPPFSAEDRRKLGQTFRRHLAHDFEPVVIPKRWRFVDELPFNDRGKLTPQALAALFAVSAV